MMMPSGSLLPERDVRMRATTCALPPFLRNRTHSRRFCVC
jgi:hypothetical protein